jgi:RimJ/RimL family protein N-acetyltransferase
MRFSREDYAQNPGPDVPALAATPVPEPEAPFDMRPLDADTVPLVAEWLANPLNYKWLDFGLGRQSLGTTALRVMQRSDSHFIRVIHEEGGRPVGIFGLHNVDNPFGNAMLWGVRARLRPPTKERTRNVLRKVLAHGFEAHGLHSVHAWVVDRNHSSAMLMRSIGMIEMGRMRKCHLLDGVPRDRILFDITREDFEAHSGPIVDDAVAGVEA